MEDRGVIFASRSAGSGISAEKNFFKKPISPLSPQSLE
jgi:hypothetical protein